jgi:catalase
VPTDDLIRQLLDVLDELSGLHPGYRPAHAKGVMLRGTFVPDAAAAALTRAPHAARPSVPVLARFSDSPGMPAIADNAPQAAPYGMAVRFYLADHAHTDVVAHSHDGFPVRTGEEFLEFLRGAAAAAKGDPAKIGAFLAAHPRARAFVEARKPAPSSFARAAYFAITAFRFTDGQGNARHGRFRLHPEAGTDFLEADAAAARSANFLFDEIAGRVAQGPVRFRVAVQLAEAGDDVADASVTWPAADRREVTFGTVSLTALADRDDPEVRKVIFDPVPRVDGIDPSGDPLTEVRSAIYLLSGRRRRAAGAKG